MFMRLVLRAASILLVLFCMTSPAARAGEKGLPRLLDLGADKCIPCQMMAPILETMEKDFAGRMEVDFIDVWKDGEASSRYGVRMIPTQIFFAPDGSELYRHTGFYSREDILAKWGDLGYDFGKLSTAMESLFTVLSRAVEGAPLVALFASLAWGVLSVILSPCHLAGIPLIIAFINGQGSVPMRRAFNLSALFGLGILATIGLIGVATAAAGRMMGDIGSWGTWLVSGLLLLTGLHLLDLLPAFWSAPQKLERVGKGLTGAFLLGLVFGIALGPCSFAFMAPVLGVVLGLSGSSALYGLLLLTAYGVGHCAVIVCAGTFTGAVQCYIDWSRKGIWGLSLRRLCGLLVAAGGVWIAMTAP